MDSPRISIVIPVYNTMRYLDRCVQSALGQTYRNTEIILVDDGSTDMSSAMCDRYAEENANVRVIHQPNGGLAAARNTGMDACTGEYILFVDSDDYMEITACEVLAGYTDRAPDLIHAGFYTHDTDGTVSEYRAVGFADGEITGSTDFVRRSVQNCTFCCTAWSYMYRREFLTANGLKYRKGWTHEDMEIFYRLLLCAETIRVIHTPIYHYIRHSGTITTKPKDWQRLHDICGALEYGYLYAQKADNPELYRYLCHELLNSYIEMAKGQHIRGWCCPHITFMFALRTAYSPRQKVRMIYHEMRFVWHGIFHRHTYYRLHREFTDTLMETYARRALIVSPKADDATLRAINTLRGEGCRVTLITSPEADTHALPEDVKIVRCAIPNAPEQRAQGRRLVKTIRKELRYGYETVHGHGTQAVRYAAYARDTSPEWELTTLGRAVVFF